MSKRKSTASEKTPDIPRSRGKRLRPQPPQGEDIVFHIKTSHDYTLCDPATHTASLSHRPRVRAQPSSMLSRDNHEQVAEKRQPELHSEQDSEPGSAEPGAYQKVNPRYGAPVFTTVMLPEQNVKDPASATPEDTLLAPSPSSFRAGNGVVTAPARKRRKAATAPRRGYPHVMGPCGFPPSSKPMRDSLMAHLLARGLVPLTEALLAACDYRVRTGFHPPRGHVPSSLSSVTERSPPIVQPTPRYSYNTRPRWLVDSPPADSVAPLLEALTPKTVSRIFDEADPRDVDRFVQLCFHLADESLLSSLLPHTFEGIGGHPYGGVFEDSSSTRYFPGGIQDSRPVPLLSSSPNAAYRSLDDLPDLDWLTPPALPPASSWALPWPSHFDASAAPEMALAYQGSWNAPYGAPSAPDARGRARWPIPPAFPFSPRSEAALILAELASGQARSRAAIRMNMRQAIAPSSDMPRLSISESPSC